MGYKASQTDRQTGVEGGRRTERYRLRQRERAGMSVVAPQPADSGLEAGRRAAVNCHVPRVTCHSSSMCCLHQLE